MAGLFVWGKNEYGELGLQDENKRDRPVELASNVFNSDVLIKVVAGLNFSVALTKCGKIYTWGSNEFGKLGQGRKIIIKLKLFLLKLKVLRLKKKRLRKLVVHILIYFLLHL